MMNRLYYPPVQDETQRAAMVSKLKTVLGHDFAYPIAIRTITLTIDNKQKEVFQVFSVTIRKTIMDMTNVISSIALIPTVVDSYYDRYLYPNTNKDDFKQRIATGLGKKCEKLVFTSL